MKKLFPEKKLTRKRVLEFFDKKGFYIVLILCIAVVGATAVFVTTRNITSSNEDFNADKIIPEEWDEDPLSTLPYLDDETILSDSSGSDTDADAPIDIAAAVPEIDADKKDVDSKPAEAEKAAAQKSDDKQQTPKEQDNTPASTDKPPSEKESKESGDKKGNEKAQSQEFIMPVIGGVTFAFAQDKLVYSKTLEEWRTHSGVDLAADRGTPVKVVADGFVSEIKHDPRFGITIIVDHQNGLKTVYANLASDDMVNPNQILKQGDIIGCVGNTALFESAEQSHLHFEVWKDNKPVNPEDYLPNKS
jgi:murein DD-endopeptidase MepM/ murein hydrolase activator NlpD